MPLHHQLGLRFHLNNSNNKIILKIVFNNHIILRQINILNIHITIIILINNHIILNSNNNSNNNSNSNSNSNGRCFGDGCAGGCCVGVGAVMRGVNCVSG
jgi:hypothetical protein